MAALRSHVDEVRARGAELAVVGNGWPEVARKFRDELELRGIPVVCDQTCEGYRIAGMRSGVGRVFNFRAAVHYARAWGKGFRQGKSAGRVWQLGGVVAIGRNGSLCYRYASKVAGDHPSIAEVIATLDQAS